jgi:DNA-3-methyladenine glycosylase II
MMKRLQVRKGVLHLMKVDPKLRIIIEKAKDKPTFEERDPFAALCMSIIYQQLAGAAASTIHKRFLNLFGGKNPTPQQLLEIHHYKLRNCGLSKQKRTYLRDLAKKVLDGTVEIKKLDHLDDEKIIEELTKVKGIGRWTAQMFLMFTLGRLDVFPSDDLGIINGMRDLYGIRFPITRDKIERIAENWRPYRTLGCWYIWQFKDNGGQSDW